MESLKYTDENDRCYGAAGMAIGLVVFDGEDMLASISIDNDPDETVKLSPDFYFAGNPGVSAKAAWNLIVKNYNIGIAMLISNLLCRNLVHQHRTLPSDLRDLLHTLAMDEGKSSCSLDEDEIDRLFDKNYNYLTRVFSHHGVQTVARDFATQLLARRTLTRLDVLESLSSLRML